MTHKYYSKEEEEYIQSNYGNMTAFALANSLGRTTSSINEKISLMGLTKRKQHKNDKSKVSEEDIKVIKALGGKMSDMDLFKLHLPHLPGRYTITRLRNRLQIPPFRTKRHEQEYDASDGYRRFKGQKVHRINAEKKLGRKLQKNEVVHHIDGNKHNNNDFDNLYICDNSSEHHKIHMDLQKTVFDLVRSGFIIFNKQKGYYEINIDNIEDNYSADSTDY